MRIARQIERLCVSTIDAGEPMASSEDFEAVRRIAEAIEQCGVSARCRPIRAHVDRAWEALQTARIPRLCVIVEARGGLPQEEKDRALLGVQEGVSAATTHCADVAAHFTQATSFAPLLPVRSPCRRRGCHDHHPRRW